MKIFSKHRRKLEPYRRFGSREFQDKLLNAKNYKRSISSDTKKADFFSRTGLTKAGIYTVAAIFAVIFYFLVISPYFLVTNIAINGNKQVSADEIKSVIDDGANHRFFLVKQNNFFLLGSSNVSKTLVAKIPLIREVKSIRSWPNKLDLQITERNPALVLAESDKNYLIDDQGFVVKEIYEPVNLLLVSDQVSEDVKVGEVLDGKIIPFIISMKNTWPTKLSQPIAKVKIPGKGASEVEFVSSEGWSAFFSTDRPVASQVNNLVVILNKLIGSKRSTLAYVDLRLSKWAYYCLKSTPCQQTDPQGLAETQTEPTTSGTQTTSPTPSESAVKNASSIKP